MNKKRIFILFLILALVFLVACAPPGAVKKGSSSADSESNENVQKDVADSSTDREDIDANVVSEDFVKKETNTDVGLNADDVNIEILEIITKKTEYGGKLISVIAEVTNNGDAKFKPKIVAYAWDNDLTVLKGIPFFKKTYPEMASEPRTIPIIKTVQFGDVNDSKTIRVDLFGVVREKGEEKQQSLGYAEKTFKIQ